MWARMMLESVQDLERALGLAKKGAGFEAGCLDRFMSGRQADQCGPG